MRNPIDALSNSAIERPKAATATILILVLGISSMTAGPLPEMLGVGIVFDNSEDAFFPDPATNEDVRILYEIEESYQSDLDLVRVLIDLEPGALETPELWAALAIGHAHMMNGTELGPYLVDPGFGASSTPYLPLGSGRPRSTLWEISGSRTFSSIWTLPSTRAMRPLRGRLGISRFDSHPSLHHPGQHQRHQRRSWIGHLNRDGSIAWMPVRIEVHCWMRR